MRVVTVTKIWKGQYVSMRDYVVRECVEMNEPILVRCQGQERLIPTHELREALYEATKTAEYQSRFTPQTYRLINFPLKAHAEACH